VYVSRAKTTSRNFFLLSEDGGGGGGRVNGEVRLRDKPNACLGLGLFRSSFDLQKKSIKGKKETNTNYVAGQLLDVKI